VSQENRFERSTLGTKTAKIATMGQKFDPSTLFQPWKRRTDLDPYKTEKNVLDAVRARKKAMLFTGVPISCIASGDDDFGRLLHMAFDRDLAVVIQNHPGTRLPRDRREPDVFVLPLDQAWRVSALNALNATAFVGEGRWSNSAEAQHSVLLGYTKKQRERWIAWQRERQAAWTCLTLYTLLTNAQKRTVQDLGRRCFDPSFADEGIDFFFPAGDGVAKANASKLVPKGLTLARCGLAWKVAFDVFGPLGTWKRRGVTSLTASEDQVRAVNAGLTSAVQFLTSKGWK
jgi:hypothetical protein